MKHQSRVILSMVLIARAACAGDGVIHNDAIWRDTQGKEIWCNGGHMIREGDVFYWVGYDTGPGRWPWKIDLYSSRNLADWKSESTVIRKEGKFGEMGWAGRPVLLHCAATGKYIIIFEADSPQQWKRHKVGFAACDRINGRYELASAEYPEGTRSTGDQSVYQEADKAYLLATMDKDISGRKYMNQSLAIFELSRDYLRVERKVFEGFDNVSGNPNLVPREHSSREASHIIKVDGVYYWFSSALVGWNSSATMYATANDLAGPWSQLKILRTDPPSQDSFNTQHDFVVPVVGKETTTWVYVGDRYSQWTKRGTGRNIFLPLTWENGGPLLRWQNDWMIDVGSGRFSAVTREEALDPGHASYESRPAPSVLAAGALPPSTRRSSAKDEAAERAKFVGVWKGFTVEGKGERPDRGPVKLELTITEKTMHGIEIQGDKRIDHGEGQFTLDLQADPPQLDGKQTLNGGRSRIYIGIYALEGDTLRWCVTPQKVRPTTFETREGQFLLILKRDKQAGRSHG